MLLDQLTRQSRHNTQDSHNYSENNKLDPVQITTLTKSLIRLLSILKVVILENLAVEHFLYFTASTSNTCTFSQLQMSDLKTVNLQDTQLINLCMLLFHTVQIDFSLQQ
jgi:hypothetical protein